ncbi:MAG: hypothetical protein FWE68_04160 [Defluviitaleaceae bacterium]|nr:hypothetical protein [Defluviitaleaceae bacterium]
MKQNGKLTERTLEDNLYGRLCDIEIYDIHSHINGSHLTARGLDDILLYHMVVSDLYSAGCPDGRRVPENPSEEERIARIRQAIPYIPYIRNTSCYYGVRLILSGLYGWDREITLDNWQEIDTVIAEKHKDSLNWAGDILRKVNVARVVTEYKYKTSGRSDKYLRFSLEWAFFTRSQWGQFDTALVELENALNKPVKTICDVHEAMESYCAQIPYDEIVSIAHHFSCDITYKSVSEAEMVQALQNRADAGEKERDIYANYLLELYLTELEKQVNPPVLLFSLGAEPLPYETGSNLSSKTIFELAALFERYPRLRFQLFLSSAAHNQALCTLCRALPNVYLAAYWWHNFFPEFMRRVMGERIDMLSSKKTIGFFSDAYCVDWVYAKSIIVRKNLAKVLAEKIEYGQLTEETAIEYARQTMRDWPEEFFE